MTRCTAPMDRIQVGEKVEIIECGPSDDDDAHVGRIGELLEDDKSERPYYVEFDDTYAWCRAEQVRRVSSSPATGKPVTAFEVGKWYTYPGHNNDKPFMCEKIEIGFAYFGGAGRNDNPPNKDVNGDIKFREVPAPSQGHTHSMAELADRLFVTPKGVDVSVHVGRIVGPYVIGSGASSYVQMTGRASRPGRPISTRSAIRRRLLGL